MVVCGKRFRNMGDQIEMIKNASSKTVVVTISLSIGLLLSWLALAQAKVICPTTNAPYMAFIEDNQGEPRVGEPFFILVRLDPDTPPPGYYVSTLVDVLQSPDGSKTDVVTGFPKIRLTMDQPGDYKIVVRVSLVAKSSCGGIDAQEILRKDLVLQTSPPAFIPRKQKL